MSLWIEQKYIHLLSPRLPDLKKKSNNVYNFRCVFCGDSQKHKNKARGYLYEIKNNFVFYCHNCGASHSFNHFLKKLDLHLYHQFIMDTLVDSGKEVPASLLRKQDEPEVELDLPSISSLTKSHIAKKYLLDRKIPEKFFSELHYSPKFMTWVNSIVPDKFSKSALNYDGPRIVIPSYTTDKKLFAVQGRTLNNDTIRYSQVIFREMNYRFYGLHRVNFNKTFYVIEGSFDSMFIDNCIAANGSDLHTGIRRLGVGTDNAVFIFDNEPRNKSIVRNVKACIDRGYNTVIWPNNLDFKDVNEAILNGYTPSEIMSLIDHSTYKSLTALVKFTEWSKI